MHQNAGSPKLLYVRKSNFYARMNDGNVMLPTRTILFQ